MPFDSLDAALDAGALIVTPNNRLARQAVMRHDAAQRAAGRTTWLAAQAMPWGAFVQHLWLQHVDTHAARAQLPLHASASLHLWQSIVEADDAALLDARGAARAAAEAYALFHEWRAPAEDARAWSGSGISDDAATFARWVARYDARLRAMNSVDRAQLPDIIAAQGGALPALPPIALLGFGELAPQQRRLLAALEARGARIEQLATPRRDARRRRVVAATPTHELECALSWARAQVLRNPDARIGIVVLDLSSRRAEVVALADEILAPERLAPLDAQRGAPYGVSLGVPLSEVSLVATALDVLALATDGLDAMSTASTLRSPYLPGPPDAWLRRARVERTWREQGRRTVRARDAAGTLERHDADLALRLRAPLPRGRAAPREWVASWTTWLADLGWPGRRALDSAEWQAREAWHALLVEFATLDDVARSIDASTALEALRALARETVWAPRAGSAPIQILGVLEATGLTFDALWLAGFGADAWPAPPRPNPFLPLAWQRARDVPRASPARELAFARLLTEQLASAADAVTVSHAREVGDAPRVASPLFAAWPLDEDAMPGSERLRDRVSAVRVVPSAWHDDEGPALPIGADAGGGTGLIESQSTCPFQAFARYRLDTEAWPEPDEGLTPMERGTLLHFAMAAFWSDVRDHATLATLDAAALESRVAHAVTAARGKLPDARWRSLAPAIAAGEAQRLTHTIVAWITRHERVRPPFTVKSVESDARLTLGGVRLRLKIDRVDAVEPDGIAIIDYKSGRTTAPSSWFKPRPAGTQVGLYTLAQRAAAPTRAVRAAAYAQIKSGEIRVCGVADDPALWPGLTTPQRVLGENASWRDVEVFWLEKLPALGEAFRRGVARVEPRAPTACQRCDLQPFCRIENLYDDDAQELAPPRDDV